MTPTVGRVVGWTWVVGCGVLALVGLASPGTVAYDDYLRMHVPTLAAIVAGTGVAVTAYLGCFAVGWFVLGRFDPPWARRDPDQPEDARRRRLANAVAWSILGVGILILAAGLATGISLTDHGVFGLVFALTIWTAWSGPWATKPMQEEAVLAFVHPDGAITASEAGELCRLNRPQATRLLQKLTSQGRLRVEGEGPGRLFLEPLATSTHRAPGLSGRASVSR